MNRLHIAGLEPALISLAAAARDCGFRYARVSKRGGRFPVVILRTRGPDDPRVECVIKWMVHHPEHELGFLGNAARP